MSDLVIKVEDLSKEYRLGEIGTGTIAADLSRFFAKVRKGEDPSAKINEIDGEIIKSDPSYVWALKGVNFEVNKGEVLAIVGRNGAGKSTLLKILSKVTKPTTGIIKLRGRVASLLEVGTGFHPELTGKENIFLNGAILGMTRIEIKRKFDEIVDFAGVQRYINTPVKRYSSGMYVRLAFAVAAHLEPEILIVDEVLAVGDSEFQKKCLGKMGQVSKEEGRTILFVSHNMAAVKSLCSRGVLLENGTISMTGSPTDIVSTYMAGSGSCENKRVFSEGRHERDFILHSIEVVSTDDKSGGNVLDENSWLQINTEITVNEHVKQLHLSFVLYGENGEPLFSFSHARENLFLMPGFSRVKCEFPKGFLNVGTFFLALYVIKDLRTTVFVEQNILSFRIHEGQRELGRWMGKEPGFIKPKFKWQVL